MKNSEAAINEIQGCVVVCMVVLNIVAGLML